MELQRIYGIPLDASEGGGLRMRGAGLEVKLLFQIPVVVVHIPQLHCGREGEREVA